MKIGDVVRFGQPGGSIGRIVGAEDGRFHVLWSYGLDMRGDKMTGSSRWVDPTSLVAAEESALAAVEARRGWGTSEPAPQGGGGEQGHSPEPWLAFRMVDEHGAPLRGEASAKYVADCISANPDGDFYAISCTKADGKDYDVCHTGNGPDSLVNAARIVACVAACLGVVDPQPGALASRDSLIAQQAGRIKELETDVTQLLSKYKAQAAEIERLKVELAQKTETVRCFTDALQQRREFLDRAFAAEARAEKAEQERDAAIEELKLMTSQALTLRKERDALRAVHVESLQRLLHRASQGDISAADVRDEIVRAKALR